MDRTTPTCADDDDRLRLSSVPPPPRSGAEKKEPRDPRRNRPYQPSGRRYSTSSQDRHRCAALTAINWLQRPIQIICQSSVNPERPNGVRGQNRNLSLISVAERNQHRHSMTPGRLAAVKDRGCPPIFTCCGYRLASKNRLPPRPLAKRRQRVRAAVPDCLTPASLRWASFISVMRDNSFWRLS